MRCNRVPFLVSLDFTVTDLSAVVVAGTDDDDDDDELELAATSFDEDDGVGNATERVVCSDLT